MEHSPAARGFTSVSTRFEHSDVISMVDKSTDHSDLRHFRNKNETGAS